MKRAWLAILLTTCLLTAWGQRATDFTAVRGVVTDSATGEPVIMASIFLKGPNTGCSTDDKGQFYLSTRERVTTVRVSAVGYTSQELPITLNTTNDMHISLASSSVALSEVVVKRKREKYSKKDNPAVALARRLIARRNQGDPRKRPYYSYTQYERVTYGLDNFVDDTIENHALDRYRFLHEYTDTVEASGRTVLPVSIKENVSLQLYASGKHRQRVLATRSDGLDETFDQESVNRFLADAFSDIDLFRNDIAFMKNRFVSPLSDIGVTFYKYYLNDTVDIDGERCVELSFVPFANQTFGFLGRLWVTVDSTLFIKKAVLNVPHAINLNWVDRVFIEQDYERLPDGTRLKTREDMTVEFMLMPNAQGLFARRVTTSSDHHFEAIDPTLMAGDAEKTYAADAERQSEQYWTAHQPQQFKNDGAKMRAMMTQLRKDKLFFWGEKLILASIHEYLPTRSRDSKIDIGPVNSIFSGNKLEGFRMKLGAMTTASLNPHWFGRAYLAYGFKDHKFKYLGELAYSFKSKKLHSREFPVHGLMLTHQYDVERLGQNFMYTSADNSLLAITRKADDKLAYLRHTALEYQLETACGFSIALSLEHNRHESSRLISYSDGTGKFYAHYNESGAQITLRYAPGEKFLQGRTYRSPINIDRPIITLTHTWMPRDLAHNLYEVSKTEVGLQKRFWFSAFGYTDIIVKGAKIWSRVSYPDLILPSANLSYTIQPETFALLDVMEFALDQSISWDVTYYLNGWLLNRVPLIKRLKWREVLSFRGVYGSLSDRNSPARHDDLLRFPDGTLCQDMGGKPYMEAGVGLDNIFRLFRVDYVWRLTHRDTPGVDRWGIRFNLHINF